jgi:hypothetical protein
LQYIIILIDKLKVDSVEQALEHNRIAEKDTEGASQMCKNLDSPHPLTPSPKDGRRGTRIMSPLSHLKGEGLGVREKI